jgi:uncharacterized protein (DUF1697 family)
MTAYVGLLRAVNVGKRQLLMSELKEIGEELGLGSPRTFIASGNLLFTSSKSESELQAILERRIGEHMGAEVPVMIRSAKELAEVAAANPVPDLPGNKVYVIFLNDRPPADAIEQAKNVTDERMAFGGREIYVAYPGGMGTSKLRIPAAQSGTARNMNTVAKLAQLAREMS